MRIARAQAALHLYPLATPIRTAFGAMRARPMLLVRLEDSDGAVGWGEIWCNFPPGAGAARRRLFDDIFAPLLKGATFDDPRAAFATLEAKTRILALQAGEPGTFAQVLAGIDQALWDISARKAGVPLWKHLGGTQGDVAVYASGLGPDGAVEQALVRLAQSYDGFKLKVGFAADADLANIAALRAALGPKAFIAVDANQAWDAETAARRVREFAEFRLGWIEEPLAVDAPEGEWQLVAGLSAAPIAGGENMRGAAQFRAAIASNAFGVIQPDIAKWGGFTGCLAVGRAAREEGVKFCPHYLGGGVGLLASAHLLAAVGGDGRLEVDAQDNPMRDTLFDDFPHVRAARLHLPDRPGLGYDPDPDLLKRYAEAA
ncbi:MAG: mandelate racemase/muconate lactonizing enzyme family protein [Rhodospirillales bacterium]|nr:mandelate racemase/muconate lactonizing enzyme family protein [Rhodospirillales bacterium]